MALSATLGNSSLEKLTPNLSVFYFDKENAERYKRNSIFKR